MAATEPAAAAAAADSAAAGEPAAAAAAAHRDAGVRGGDRVGGASQVEVQRDRVEHSQDHEELLRLPQELEVQQQPRPADLGEEHVRGDRRVAHRLHVVTGVSRCGELGKKGRAAARARVPGAESSRSGRKNGSESDLEEVRKGA